MDSSYCPIHKGGHIGGLARGAFLQVLLTPGTGTRFFVYHVALCLFCKAEKWNDCPTPYSESI